MIFKRGPDGINGKRFKCPVCGEAFYISPKMHITQKAKRETFLMALKRIKTAPHFEFYKAHTIIMKNTVWVVA